MTSTFHPDQSFTAVVVPGSPARTLLVQESNRDDHHYYHWSDEVVFDVFEQVGDEYVLLTVADPMTEDPSPAVLANLIHPRNQALGRLLAGRKIVANGDYPDPAVYEDLYSEDPLGRFVALTEDETYQFAWACDTLDLALDCLSAQAGNNTGGLVVGVYDLDADTLLNVTTTVTLAAPQEEGYKPYDQFVTIRDLITEQQFVALHAVLKVEVGYIGTYESAVLAHRPEGLNIVFANFPDTTLEEVTAWLREQNVTHEVTVQTRWESVETPCPAEENGRLCVYRAGHSEEFAHRFA
jgi:hypothetical protein